jgi:hypothetical protein
VRRRHLIAAIGAAALGVPLAARAQQKPMPVIGFLGISWPGPAAFTVAAFREGLGKSG